MKAIKFLTFSALFVLLTSCKNDNDTAKAYGNFEVDEVTISSKSQGELLAFSLEEGSTIKKGEIIGYVDTIKLHLQRAEFKANLKAIQAQEQNIRAQLTVARDDLSRLKKDQSRISNMYTKKAATQKQLDDINSAVTIATNKLQVLQTQFPAISAQADAVQAKSEMLNQQIKDAIITNPINGTVLTKMVYAHEIVVPGKPIYVLANLDNIYLKAFISGSQLGEIQLGQKVNVQTDLKDGSLKSHEGVISWISNKAEFTPKNIQTREERVGQVYAIKIRVPNNGDLKIGMPGEVVWEDE